MYRDYNNEDALLVYDHAIVLDTRTVEEYCAGHIKGAYLIPSLLPPYSDRELKLMKDQIWFVLDKNKVAKDRPILIYCKTGKRATVAKNLLQELGYTNAIVWGGSDKKPLVQIFEDGDLICNCTNKIC
jgi:rhodanese-related sulfurtransferase